MKILVTGGAGFIGSQVVPSLLSEGHEVVVLDDLSTGRKNRLPKEVELYELDIRDWRLVAVLKEVEPDIVVHLAAQVDVRKSVSDPLLDAEINILGTVNVATAFLKSPKAKKFIFISTAAVYGSEAKVPILETSPLKPESPYGLSKLTAERYLSLLSTEAGFDLVTLRLGNVYGPGQDAHGEAGVIAIFSQKVLKGETLSIFGDGEQTRDFVFVKDVARAITLAISEGERGSFNIATGEETKINDLIRIYQELTPTSFSVKYEPSRSGEILRSSLDISKAKEELSFTPEYSLLEGLSETLSGFRND